MTQRMETRQLGNDFHNFAAVQERSFKNKNENNTCKYYNKSHKEEPIVQS